MPCYNAVDILECLSSNIKRGLGKMALQRDEYKESMSLNAFYALLVDADPKYRYEYIYIRMVHQTTLS